MLVSYLSVGASLVFFDNLDVGCMSCILEGGLRPPSFLIGMWFCFVFCVEACLVLFVSLVVRGVSSTSENGLRPPSLRIGNIGHVVLLVVLC